VHSITGDKSDDMKNSLYEKIERVFSQFPKYRMKILLGGFYIRVGRGDIFNNQSGMSIHLKNNNGVRVVKFVTLANLIAKCTMLPHHDIQKYIWNSPNWKTHKQIDHVLIQKWWHSNVSDVRYFKGALTIIWWL
jgi:hypothetical protein